MDLLLLLAIEPLIVPYIDFFAKKSESMPVQKSEYTPKANHNDTGIVRKRVIVLADDRADPNYHQKHARHVQSENKIKLRRQAIVVCTS